MLSRCYNKNNPSHKYYFEKGIKVCDRWLGPEGFTNFLKDMGKRPGAKYSIDRVNVNKDYSPDNCRWTTWIGQAGNKTNNNDVVGVARHKMNGGWSAYISVNGKRLMKCFRTKEEAIAKRKEWESTLL